MSMDQVIMDKFVEQTQEILVLKASNRVLNFEIENLESKLKIAVDALNTILMASQKSEESHALNVY